ncbi:MULTISPECIES: hypothetical protein [Emticicia]|uniref:hypothetical protein n=1 Tax=Emticicia TaxID=312278 RepID=UPI000C792581|nr:MULTISPECIES: hypothetical protein [Emticicia]PLK45532.1 hypothetical protein C0V77_05195 [Emticicia sp. TH156]UTA69508.1 hypothetical protein MB380_06775 [Emticicia sp. 21SJ11W-3]
MQHHEPPENNTSSPAEASSKDKVWTFFFAIMYPVITLFGLLFTGIVAVFSAISRVLVFLLRLIRK